MINPTLYFFADLGSGIKAYPQDSAMPSVFQPMARLARGTKQIVVRREDGLIYYAYIHRLSNAAHYVGLCVVLNSVMLRGFKSLFATFDNAYTSLTLSGKIIGLDPSGDVVVKESNLSKNILEIEGIFGQVRPTLANWPSTAQLPAVSYGVSYKSDTSCSVGADPDAAIVKKCHTYGFTLVNSSQADGQLAGYQQTLKELNDKNSTLKAENAKLQRAKKQTLVVSVLAVCLLIGCVAGYYLWDNWDKTEKILKDAQSDNRAKSDTIGVLSSANGTLQTAVTDANAAIAQLRQNYNLLRTDFDSLQGRYNELSSERDDLQQTVNRKTGELYNLEQRYSSLNSRYNDLNSRYNNLNSRYNDLSSRYNNLEASQGNLVITDAHFNFDNGNLFFTYSAKRQETVSLTIRASGSKTIVKRFNLDIRPGKNTASGFIEKKLKGTYTFSIIRGDVVIGGCKATR